MKRTFLALALVCGAALPLAGCAGPGYSRVGVGYAWTSYPYSVWYDGYYGPFYDGYWGLDGFFYFRLLSTDRVYRRASAPHVYRVQPRAQPRTSQRYKHYQGETRRPPDGSRMPSYPPDRSPGRSDNRSRDRR